MRFHDCESNQPNFKNKKRGTLLVPFFFIYSFLLCIFQFHLHEIRIPYLLLHILIDLI